MLISSQIHAGICTLAAVGNIRRQRQALGFSEATDQALQAWEEMLSEGHPQHEFFLRHVMPADFQEGARLTLNAQLSSFEQALHLEARR